VIEYYESPAGIARHWEDTLENWSEMSSTAPAWFAKATIATLHNGTAVQAPQKLIGLEPTTFVADRELPQGLRRFESCQEVHMSREAAKPLEILRRLPGLLEVDSGADQQTNKFAT
jgi:hypothetical protein